MTTCTSSPEHGWGSTHNKCPMWRNSFNGRALFSEVWKPYICHTTYYRYRPLRVSTTAQTGAGNLKIWKLENLKNIKNDPWDMLNIFCFHVYTQKSRFIGQNFNGFFWTSSSSSSPHDIRVHRAGSQLKILGKWSSNIKPLSIIQKSLGQPV